MPTDNQNDLKPNTILVNRYKINAVTDQQEQTVFYRARDLHFPEVRRMVTVKAVHVQSTDDTPASVIARNAQREANILASISHQAAPYLMDMFSFQDTVFSVMQLLEGDSLERLVSGGKKIDLANIVQWGIDLASFLEYLHGLPSPIIHRDIASTNLLLEANGFLRVTSFNFAKVWTKGESNTIVGTEGYAAPEQYRGKATPLSDIFGLGATLHHLATGVDPRLEVPFSFSERPIQRYTPDAPGALQDVIEKALAFRQEDRFQNATEFKEALQVVQAQVLRGALPEPQINRPAPRPEKHVFLSYSRSNQAIMGQVASTLEKRRIKVWTDRNLTPGTRSWQRAIEEAIRASGALVVLLSPDARKSDWVREEMNYAEMCGVKIFPVLIQGPEHEAVPFGFSLTQYIDLTQDEDSGHEQQLNQLSHFLTAHLLSDS